MRNGNLFVISGPSGAGKGTLVRHALSQIDDAWVSVSATTREPRRGERDGVHYFFMDEDGFSAMAERDGFLEWARYAGNGYGTPRASVEEHIARGEQVILEIDMQGAFQVREKMPEAKLVFIEPPSMAELERRLRQRGQRIRAAQYNAVVGRNRRREIISTVRVPVNIRVRPLQNPGLVPF